LREACIIEGKPYFLKILKKEETDFLAIEPFIEEETRKLVPPYQEEYPYEPYSFDDARELNQFYLPRAREETIDSLYEKIKSMTRLFIDTSEMTLNLISANLLGSYFQDKFSTVHYLIIVGDNGTGKSAIADLFDALGYRTVVMTNPTRAIWYRVLGDIEFGQVTIIADESEGIEESPEIMSILKDGYQTKHKIPRMDSENKKPEWFYPFCIKIIICENSPTEYKAKGLLDRSFKIKTYRGNPKLDIKEVRNPQGNKNRQRWFNEINDLRKLLLVFKLYHSDNPLPEIDINLDGRDKELCKPLIQLFFNTQSQKEIETTLQHFIDAKNERKGQSLEAQMYPILVNAISENGKIIPSRTLWQLITENLDGEIDGTNPNLFNSTEFGRLYINRVTKIACDKFGGESKHQRKGSSLLVFNEQNLAKMENIYAMHKQIETKSLDSQSCEPCESCEPSRNDEGSISLVNRLQMDESPRCENAKIEEEYTKSSNNLIGDMIETTQNVSHASHASQQPEYPSHCYYCDEIFNGIGVQSYKKHVIQKHPKMPCFPGKADLKLYSLRAQGFWWE
jgi:hypothetical protein